MTKAATQKRLLIVDDDDALRETLADQLALHDDYHVTQAVSGQEALRLTKDQTFDLILLDVTLGDMDGRDVCRLLRKQAVKSPVIMLTGADSDADTILGLDAGANDYITKPFKLNVLLARLRAQRRQHQQSDDAVFGIGPYSFQPSLKMLTETTTDKKIRLTEKETAILKFLYRSGQAVVARETLLGEVWGYNAEVNTHTLETHIYRLRQKIEPRAGEATLLVTEPGGYRLAV